MKRFEAELIARQWHDGTARPEDVAALVNTVSEVYEKITRAQVDAGLLGFLREHIQAGETDKALALGDNLLRIVDKGILEMREAIDDYQETVEEALEDYNQQAIRDGREPFTGTVTEYQEWMEAELGRV
jgi:hypothetical protein